MDPLNNQVCKPIVPMSQPERGAGEIRRANNDEGSTDAKSEEYESVKFAFEQYVIQKDRSKDQRIRRDELPVEHNASSPPGYAAD